ncbi:unnamed protein product [Phytomonas sp. Hart1]|nr:unnamed protein product [Phytomonas sp. Hart1]|eukprot:CCW66107.1 unnamed protein product [Phytomonas sp. isolate Hart1]
MNFYAIILIFIVLFSTLSHADTTPYDPTFHIFVPQHWINDPNGPYRDPVTGKIHLYMQYNPHGAVWGDMSWYHVTSDDYVKWKRSESLSMTNDRWYDLRGVYSGTMINNHLGDPVAIYACVENAGAEDVAQGRPDIQRVCTASPSKADLKGKRTLDIFEKNPVNPVLSEHDVPGLVYLNNFRDPTELWADPAHADEWLLAAIARVKDDEGDNAHVVLFRTADPTFMSGYKFSHTLYTYHLEPMLECPDFFTVDSTNGYFLKFSTMEARREFIVYGNYQPNEAKDQYVYVEDTDRTNTFIDFGPYYASKTFYDPILKQRMIWGWVPEEMEQTQNLKVQGWAGVQVLRGIAYDEKQKRLKYPPIPELKALRRARLLNKTLVLSSDIASTVLTPFEAVTIHQEIIAKFTFPASLFDGTKGYTKENAPEVGLRIRTNTNGSEYTTVKLRMPAATPESNVCHECTYLEGRNTAFKIYSIKNDKEAEMNCSKECAKERTCESWALDETENKDMMQCSLYWDYNSKVSTSNKVASSGVVNEPILYLERNKSGTIGYNFPLHGRAPLASNTELELRIFVDGSVIEVFKDDGLQTISGRVYIPDGVAHSGVGLYTLNTGDANVSANIQVFSMGNIWN